jgi:hypothetical protein
MHRKSQTKSSAALRVTSTSNLDNPTLNKKNENEKIDNWPNEFRRDKLPN